ncbi:hypothetical protein KBD34_05820, partial [Patescibacteria group bacterium]|nr:hypothetical protein [Patescibacteria group bacterium]
MYSEKQLQALSSPDSAWTADFKALIPQIQAVEDLQPAEKAAIMNLLVKDPVHFYEGIDRAGLLGKLFPELEAMKGLEQDPSNHAEGDADRHNRLIIGNIARLVEQPSPALVLATLFHDVEKRSTQGRHPKTGAITFYGHAQKGVKTFQTLKEKWNIPDAIAAESAWLIEHHVDLFLPPKQLQADVEAGKGLVSKLFLDSPPGWGANLLHLLHADALSSWREGSTPVHPITDTHTVEYLADKLPGLQKRAQEKQWQKDRQDRVKVYVGDALRRGTVPKDAEVLKTARLIIDGRVTKEQETLDPARVDRLARRAVSIESFKAELEQAEGSEQDMKRLFLHAFDEAGTQEKITLLDKRGWLEKVVPEFARNRELTQDERWHGKEQVGEHLIAAIGYMDDLIDQNPPFANPRYEKLLRLSAFFHDMGKNEDPENA